MKPLLSSYSVLFFLYHDKTMLHPFPKTFNLNFPPDRTHDNKKAHVVITWVAPYPGENLKLKVLGREFEGGPFFKRVSLNS